MKILLTGAAGFIGRNLRSALEAEGSHQMLLYEYNDNPSLLRAYASQCDFVFHLAGVNRPQDPADFMVGNRDLTQSLVAALEEAGNCVPVLLSSSIQAALDNPYGRSKRAGEDVIFDYGRRANVAVYVYRLPNVFGKWCRPNYNSAVATFCHNIAHGLPITVSDPATELRLAYIDDVTAAFTAALSERATRDGDFCVMPVEHRASLGEIVALLESYRDSRQLLALPDCADPFSKKLYATYLSYLPQDAFAYPLTSHRDARGAFTEVFRTPERGQISINVSRPGVTKGNHWHHTKNEKFLVVSGQGVIRFRQYGEEEIFAYLVSGDAPQVVDIPPGYTHNIENTGDSDMVTLMWANECFDPENPDTYPLEV